MTTKKLLLLTCILLINTFYGQTKYPLQLSMDSDMIKKQIDWYGIPSGNVIRTYSEQSYNAFNEKNWPSAIYSLNYLSRDANFMSILLKSGLKPYYRFVAEKNRLPSEYAQSSKNHINELISLYTKIRDEALIMTVECHINLDEEKLATEKLFKAFDILDVQNDEQWNRALINLHKLLEIDNK